MNGKRTALVFVAVVLCSTVSAADALVRFSEPWTSPYRVDPNRPFHLVNAEGKHLFLVNKTAWLYFGCMNPEAVLDRADLVSAALAHPDRSVSLVYVCTRATGQTMTGASVRLRLPSGNYRVMSQSPADLAVLGSYDYPSGGLGHVETVGVPEFADDLIITAQRVKSFKPTRIPGTQ